MNKPILPEKFTKTNEFVKSVDISHLTFGYKIYANSSGHAYVECGTHVLLKDLLKIEQTLKSIYKDSYGDDLSVYANSSGYNWFKFSKLNVNNNYHEQMRTYQSDLVKYKEFLKKENERLEKTIQENEKTLSETEQNLKLLLSCNDCLDV